MAQKHNQEPEHPDTTTHIVDAITKHLDHMSDELLNPDAPALTEEMRQRARAAAERRLNVKRQDTEGEYVDLENRVVDLKVEFEETGDTGIGEALDQIKPHHLQALVDKGNLPTDPKSV